MTTSPARSVDEGDGVRAAEPRPAASAAPPEGSVSESEAVFAIGLAGNLGLAVLKLLVGWWAGSRSLVADGLHSLSDLVTNGGVWLAYRWAKSPPDEDHHYGHGNAEPLAGMVVGVVLFFGGLGVIWEAFAFGARLQGGRATVAALGVAVLSMLVNVGLAWITWREGRRLRSQGLIALARDNASDVLTAWLVILGVSAAALGFHWAETAAACAIGILIVWMGITSGRAGLDVLMDRTPDPGLRDSLRTVALAVPAVRGVQSVRVHPLGSILRVDMEISVDGALSVAEGHEIADEVEGAITAANDAVHEVHVHVNPWVPPEQAPVG